MLDLDNVIDKILTTVPKEREEDTVVIVTDLVKLSLIRSDEDADALAAVMQTPYVDLNSLGSVLYTMICGDLTLPENNLRAFLRFAMMEKNNRDTPLSPEAEDMEKPLIYNVCVDKSIGRYMIDIDNKHHPDGKIRHTISTLTVLKSFEDAEQATAYYLSLPPFYYYVLELFAEEDKKRYYMIRPVCGGKEIDLNVLFGDLILKADTRNVRILGFFDRRYKAERYIRMMIKDDARISTEVSETEKPQ